MKTITFAAILIICALGALISPTGNAQDQGAIAAWTSFDGRADAEKVSIESMTYEELPVGGGSSSSGSGGGGQVVVSAAQPQSAPIEGDFICDGQDPQGNDTGACRFQPTPTRPTAPAPDPATTTPPPLIVTAHDIATLIVDGSGITLQPPGNTILLHMPLIAHTNPATRTLTTTIANTTIDIEATPTTYTWNWGDNTTTTTTDPGHPYPNHTITHQYTTTNNTTTITLTTTWTARYKPTNTTNWKPITGYITTTQTTPPLTIHRLTPYLTNDTQHHHNH